MAQNFLSLTRSIHGCSFNVGKKLVIDKNCNLNGARIRGSFGSFSRDLTISRDLKVNSIKNRTGSSINVNCTKFSKLNSMQGKIDTEQIDAYHVRSNVIQTSILDTIPGVTDLTIEPDTNFQGIVCAPIIQCDRYMGKTTNLIKLDCDSKVFGDLDVTGATCTPELMVDLIVEKTPDQGIMVQDLICATANIKTPKILVDSVMENTPGNGVCIGNLPEVFTIDTIENQTVDANVMFDSSWQSIELQNGGLLKSVNIDLSRKAGFESDPIQLKIYQGIGTGGMELGTVNIPAYNGGSIDLSPLDLSVGIGSITFQLDHPGTNLNNFVWNGHTAIPGDPPGASTMITLHLTLEFCRIGGLKVNDAFTCVENTLKLEFPQADCNVQFANVNVEPNIGLFGEGLLDFNLICDGNLLNKTISFDGNSVTSNLIVDGNLFVNNFVQFNSNAEFNSNVVFNDEVCINDNLVLSNICEKPGSNQIFLKGNLFVEGDINANVMANVNCIADLMVGILREKVVDAGVTFASNVDTSAVLFTGGKITALDLCTEQITAQNGNIITVLGNLMPLETGQFTLGNVDSKWFEITTNNLNVCDEARIQGNIGVLSGRVVTNKIAANLVCTDMLNCNLASDILVGDSLIPEMDNMYDLGNAAQKWRNIQCYDLTVCDSAIVQGNLTILGNTTTINTEMLTVEDNKVVVNSLGLVPGLDGGLCVNRFQDENDACLGDVIQDTPFENGTAVAATASTITLAPVQMRGDDFFNDWWIKISAGTGINQVRRITDFDGTSNIADINTNWTITPDVTSDYELFPCKFITSYWSESENKWTIGCTPNGNSTVVTRADFVDLQVGQICSRSVIPHDNKTFNLGGVGNNWNEFWVSNVNVCGNVDLVGIQSKVNGDLNGNICSDTTVFGNLTVLGNVMSMTMIDVANIDGDLNVTGNVIANKLLGNLFGNLCEDTTVFGNLNVLGNVMSFNMMTDANFMGDVFIAGNINSLGEVTAQKFVGNLLGNICTDTSVLGNVTAEKFIGQLQGNICSDTNVAGNVSANKLIGDLQGNICSDSIVEGNLTVLGNLNAMIMIDASNIMGDLNVTGNVNAPKIVGNLDGDICDDTTVFGTLTATANVVAQKLVGNLFGGICYNTTVVSAASYSVNANDDFIFVDRTTTGTATITLPVISTLPNLRKIYHIVDSGGNASTNNITINRSGGDTINGETSALIDLDNNSISVVADLGSRWIIF